MTVTTHGPRLGGDPRPPTLDALVAVTWGGGPAAAPAFCDLAGRLARSGHEADFALALNGLIRDLEAEGAPRRATVREALDLLLGLVPLRVGPPARARLGGAAHFLS